jgi:2-aminoadipate transaminase
MKTDLPHLSKETQQDGCSSSLFANRMHKTSRSFLREILKLASSPNIISFAGGVPNPDYFPIEQLKEAAIKVFNEDGRSALQYSITEGYYPLREYICERYKSTKGLILHPEEILITNGSQQGLDLIGKIFLNEGDGVLLEKPSYLGAIQALSAYQPEFYNADLLEDGIDVDQLSTIVWENKIKLFYTVPDFQNPTGISYSRKKREEVSNILKNYTTLIVEDNPYGEIRFEGEDLPSFKKFLPEQTIMLGSFSKTIAPGLRLGWIACKKEFMDKIIVAKQAADLHSNFLSQRILYTYLKDNDIESHLQKIREAYKKQRDTMLDLIKNNFSPQIKFTQPSGGLFIWLTLPANLDAYTILSKAIEAGIAFVPGNTFFQDGKGKNTIRLSFSNYNEEEMKTGMVKLSKLLNNYINN